MSDAWCGGLHAAALVSVLAKAACCGLFLCWPICNKLGGDYVDDSAQEQCSGAI
jgi:hypothetical protein